MKYFGYEIGNTPLVVKQNNYWTKIINTYIVYHLNGWPKVLLKNFALESYLFGAFNIGIDDDKSKYAYSGYGIAFD